MFCLTASRGDISVTCLPLISMWPSLQRRRAEATEEKLLHAHALQTGHA